MLGSKWSVNEEDVVDDDDRSLDTFVTILSPALSLVPQLRVTREIACMSEYYGKLSPSVTCETFPSRLLECNEEWNFLFKVFLLDRGVEWGVSVNNSLQERLLIDLRAK